MAGDTHEVPAEPSSVIATDNRIFRTLADWDIDLSAAPVDLMDDSMEETKKYTDNDDTLNIGNHREPDMEMLTAAEPDSVLNRQRFSHREADTDKDIDGNVTIV